MAESFTSAHVLQVVNYLRASGLPVGLLFNFGVPKVGCAACSPDFPVRAVPFPSVPSV